MGELAQIQAIRLARMQAAVPEFISSRTELVKGPDGAPRLLPQEQSRHISISHSGNEEVLALSELPVGVDYEWVRRERPWGDMARRFLHPEVANWCLSAPDSSKLRARFTSCWCAIEAVLKLSGRGLANALWKQQVCLDSAGRIASVVELGSPDAQATPVQVFWMDEQRCVALAGMTSPWQVICHSWPLAGQMRASGDEPFRLSSS
jgi:phosphopantetheinyl transferase